MRLNKKDGLNIVPFIDIMLVLLAIVLSISTFIAQGKIKVDLPQAAHSQKKNDENSIVVVVDKDNRIFIDDNETNIDELSAKLKTIENKTLIELKSDKEAKFDSFVKIVDILKEKGHENFAIRTLSK